MPKNKMKRALNYLAKATPTPTPSPTPGIDWDAMDEEAKKRSMEPTGAWRKRRGLGKPKWWESEY